MIENCHYRTGSKSDRLSPDSYLPDIALMSRPGAEEIQLDLLFEYRSNLERYREFQDYFREDQPPLLAVWGRHDPVFIHPAQRLTDAISSAPK